MRYLQAVISVSDFKNLRLERGNHLLRPENLKIRRLLLPIVGKNSWPIHLVLGAARGPGAWGRGHGTHRLIKEAIDKVMD